MSDPAAPPSVRAAQYLIALQPYGLESAAGADRLGVPDVVFVKGRHAAALCAAYEVAQALGFGALRRAWDAVTRLGRGTPDPAVHLAVPGGRTAAALFDALCAPPFANQVQWPRLRLYFADERSVPPTDPESNYRLAREHLIDPLMLPESQVHRMRGEAGDLAAAAREYAVLLERPLDLVVLGLGEDGHVASLFPGSPLIEEHDRRVAVVEDSPKPPPRRLTLTPRAFAEARRVLVVSEGKEKSAAAMRALEVREDARRIPARMLRDAQWIVSG